MSTDPLLQPFQLKHLTLRNRIVITSHEPAYSEGGMPKERYRRYHEERARGGVAMTMTAGSLHQYLQGVRVDDDSLALEAWEDIEPGGVNSMQRANQR